jgi:hypothetical protein
MTIRTKSDSLYKQPLMAKTKDNKWGSGAKMLYIRDGKVGFAIYSPSDAYQFESI